MLVSFFFFCDLLLPLVSVCGTECSLVLLSLQMVAAAMKLKDLSLQMVVQP